jgi:hypothetical protein
MEKWSSGEVTTEKKTGIESTINSIKRISNFSIGKIVSEPDHLSPTLHCSDEIVPTHSQRRRR